jgi:hypothetical protein
MIGLTVKFFSKKEMVPGLSSDSSKNLKGVVMDQVFKDGNTKYLVVTNPQKFILLIDPDSIYEIEGLAFGVSQIGGLHNG